MAKNNRTIDRIQAVWNILGGEEGVDRLLVGRLKVVEACPPEFPIWKTVRLGTCKSSSGYAKALRSAGMRIGGWGGDILSKISYSKEEIDLNLVVLSVAELGFKEGATYVEICAKAIQLGLELCPAEVGPALLLQYGDPPQRGERLYIAMEAISNRLNYRCIFTVEHNAGAWLDGDNGGHLVHFWSAAARFVFVRCK